MNTVVRNLFFLIVGLAILFSSIILYLNKPQTGRTSDNSNISTVRVGDVVINVEVADDPMEQARGLSGREELEKGSGMLFIFNTSGKYGFWMKDMNFPIDIVWIDETGLVTDIEEQISPDTYPQILYPTSEIKYVLETPAGYAETAGIDIGDVVFFESNPQT